MTFQGFVMTFLTFLNDCLNLVTATNKQLCNFLLSQTTLVENTVL